ncbi:MAG: hypothetical protein II528_00190 [Lachnospiraceae bacterium]|nr:hypothetical protein [Lachnospiraceae bacterium]
MQEEKKKKEITAATLKWIAVITMIIDHFGASILEAWMTRSTLPYIPSMGFIDLLIRAVGRLAFPIFIFLMVEGLYHTRNRWKYLGRLVLLAVISEVPFDWAFWITRFQKDNGILVEFAHQNVFFTLSIGLLMMILLEMVRPHSHFFALDREVAERDGTEIAQEAWYLWALRLLACAVIMAACMALNEFISADYGATGIVGFIGMYWGNVFWRTNWRSFLLGLGGIICLNGFEAFALFDLIFIRRYNGQKGNSMNKWFFYFVYPVHLAIYGVIVMFYII